jgi:hypothetical protein
VIQIYLNSNTFEIEYTDNADNDGYTDNVDYSEYSEKSDSKSWYVQICTLMYKCDHMSIVVH